MSFGLFEPMTLEVLCCCLDLFFLLLGFYLLCVVVYVLLRIFRTRGSRNE